MSERSRRIRETKRRSGTSSLPAASLPALDRPVKFSFRHLDNSKEKFSLKCCDLPFHNALIEKLCTYSTWTVDSFTDQANNENRHVITFAETTEPAGFAHLDPDQLGAHEAWQFGLAMNKSWRVHGILIDDTFYIVWFDPNHALYPLTLKANFS